MLILHGTALRCIYAFSRNSIFSANYRLLCTVPSAPPPTALHSPPHLPNTPKIDKVIMPEVAPANLPHSMLVMPGKPAVLFSDLTSDLVYPAALVSHAFSPGREVSYAWQNLGASLHSPCIIHSLHFSCIARPEHSPYIPGGLISGLKIK